MTAGRRLLVYIVPVTVISFSLSVPKFMEVLYILLIFLTFFMLPDIFPVFLASFFLLFFRLSGKASWWKVCNQMVLPCFVFLFFRLSGKASWWRVCNQKVLPCFFILLFRLSGKASWWRVCKKQVLPCFAFFILQT